MSTPTISRNRVRAGVTTGGQFDTQAKSESDVALSPATPAEDVFTKRYDSVEDKVEAFKAELDKRVADLDTDEDWLRYLDVMSRFHRYSFNNQMLIALQRPDFTKVAGYRKWQEMGRQVEKGQKGISILAPKMRRLPVKDASGNVLTDDKGKERWEPRVVGFTTTSVFDVSQTDGDPLPELAEDFDEEPPEGYIEDLMAEIESHAFMVSIDKVPGAADGFTNFTNREVVVDESLSPQMQAKVLAHELGHIMCGHGDRLEEYHAAHKGARGQMEVEAESYAYTLSRANGMSTQVGDVSGTYVAGWARAAGPEAVKEAGQSVSKAIKKTLAEGSWSNVEDD